MALDHVYGLCLGGNVFGWTADRDDSFAVLDAYVEAGGNFIDTADSYMRPNMGISETIIGEWMAARGNRDALVIATKVGLGRWAVGREHRPARRRVARAAADGPHRPLLRPQGRRRRCRSRRPCARSTRRCATARCATSRRPTSRRTGWSSRCELAGARAWRPTSGCSRTTTWSSVRATSATTRRSWSGTGCPSRPTTRSPAAS